MPKITNVGTFELLPHEELVAGTWVTLTFRHVVGPSGLGAGAVWRIGLPYTSWSEPLVALPRYWPEVAGALRTYAPFRRTNTTAELITESGASVHLRSFEAMMPSDHHARDGLHGEKTNWRHWIDVLIERGTLAPGDEIRVVYGDLRFGERGARIQTIPGSNVSFLAFIDPTGEGLFDEHPDSPINREVHPGPPALARVVVPSIVRPGEPFAARIAIMDASHNRPRYGFAGNLQVRMAAEGHTRDVQFEREGPQHVAVNNFTLEDERHTYLTLQGDLPEVRSNPVQGSASAERIFWGDIHVHSMYHDYNEAEARGRNDVAPDECYAYAKEVSFLDFAAITDSDPSRFGWEQNQEAAERHNEPGRFVTFRGYEAGGDQGHRHVIFASGGVEPRYPPDFDYRFPALYDLYRGRDDVIMIPHHTKAFATWHAYDPDLEPLAEIYSSWGSSERPGPELWEKQSISGASVQEALIQGYRLGMVASGDICPWPGRCYPGTYHKLAPFSGGLVAVFAEELTRQAVFEALQNRRCYATTGGRMILRFSVNGVAMGQDILLPSRQQPRQILISIVGTQQIELAEIIKNGETLATERSDDEGLEWSFEDTSSVELGDFYYLRVTQSDGQRAWSSPIWVDFEP